jgi:hypothetical protein
VSARTARHELSQAQAILASLWRVNEEMLLTLVAIENTAQTTCDSEVIAGIARAANERIEANAATILQLAAHIEAWSKAAQSSEANANQALIGRTAITPVLLPKSIMPLIAPDRCPWREGFLPRLYVRCASSRGLTPPS